MKRTEKEALSRLKFNKMEEELHEKIRLFRILLDAFPCVALLLRSRTREIVLSNEAAVKVGAVPGAQCFATWGQRQDPCPWCLAPSLWATGKAQHLEIEALGIVWDAYWIPVDENLYMHFAFDITARKSAEKALSQSEERYRQVVENANDIIFITDINGNYQFANSAGLKASGYALEELQKLNYLDLIVPEHRRRVQFHYMKQYLRKIPATYIEYPFKSKAGDVVWFGQNATLITEHDAVKGFHLIARDITERKKTEEELKKMYGEVIARHEAMLNISEDLMKEIEERKEAEEKIKEYSDRLRKLASQMSLIEEQERRRIANVLHDSIGQTLALSKIKLEELKELASSESLSLPLDELREAIDQTINTTRSLTYEISPPILYELGFEKAIEWLGEQMLKQHNILFGFMDDRQAKPLSDSAQVLLFQAIREFMVNIIKHSGAHNVKISVQKDENNIRINIEDDGIGFSVTDVDSKMMESGSFGLFSVRERLVLIGGNFRMKSEPGKGTHITLTAPLESEKEVL